VSHLPVPHPWVPPPLRQHHCPPGQDSQGHLPVQRQTEKGHTYKQGQHSAKSPAAADHKEELHCTHVVCVLQATATQTDPLPP
jgi:hypothetical protein